MPPAPMELSIVMPCLNEAETLATCVDKALGVPRRRRGSTARSSSPTTAAPTARRQLAEAAGARVVARRRRKGYGAALIGGIAAARGTLRDHGRRRRQLRLLGARRRSSSSCAPATTSSWATASPGGIAAGRDARRCTATSATRCCRFIGRLFFRMRVGDFHCGLRGFRRDSILALDLRTTGMEFASEMVVKATLAGLDDRRGADHAAPRRPQPARRTCAPGATAGATCGSCCSTARAGCSSTRASLPSLVGGRSRGRPRRRPDHRRRCHLRRQHAGGQLVGAGASATRPCCSPCSPRPSPAGRGCCPRTCGSTGPGPGSPSRRRWPPPAWPCSSASSACSWPWSGGTSTRRTRESLRLVVPSTTVLVLGAQTGLASLLLSVLALPSPRPAASTAAEPELVTEPELVRSRSSWQEDVR